MKTSRKGPLHKKFQRTNAIERHTIITLSTGHLPESLSTVPDGLHRTAMDHLCSMSGEFGWLLHVDKDLSSVEKFHEESIVGALREILWWAKRRGAHYVMFDADGPYVDRFAVYDW